MEKEFMNKKVIVTKKINNDGQFFDSILKSN